MTKQRVNIEQQKARSVHRRAKAADNKATTLTNLPAMAHLGNSAIQRLLAQRSGDGAFDLDDATAGRINAARGGGKRSTTRCKRR